MVSQSEHMAELMHERSDAGRHLRTVALVAQFVAASIAVNLFAVEHEVLLPSAFAKIPGVRPYQFSTVRRVSLSVAGIEEVDIVHLPVAVGIIVGKVNLTVERLARFYYSLVNLSVL